MKILDMHCDTVSVLLEKGRRGEEVSLRENGEQVDLLRMKQAGYLLQNFALFVNKESCVDPWQEVCALYEVYCKELEANSDIAALVLRYEDIAGNEEKGKMSAMLTVEEGAVCKGEISKLHELYDMGVRMLTLTWNYPNGLGNPNLDITKPYTEDFLFTPELERGLTRRGKEFVAEMERLHMIIDVSHMSDAGFYDVCRETTKPFVASHSNARGVCRNVRNLSDDMIRRLSERGGCMGLNYCADFLEEGVPGKENPGTIAAVVRHAKYIMEKGGIEVLGLGSDFDGIPVHKELPGVQSMELLWDALHRAGFTQAQLDKIFYKNVLRVYRDCL